MGRSMLPEASGICLAHRANRSGRTLPPPRASVKSPFFLLIAGCVAAAFTVASAAAAPNRPVHVVMEAASPCLDKAAFERALFARITRPRGRGVAEETKVLVSVEVDGPRFSGRVTIIEPGEPSRERVVHGSSCDDVALSVVLVAALALGGEPEPDPNRLRVREAADEAADERPRPALPPGPAPWARVVGAHAGLGAAGGGEASASGDVFGELSSLRPGLSPGLRVALGYATGARSDGAVTVNVSTATVRLEPSVVRIQSGPVAARLVLSFEGGAAFASASGAMRSESVTRPWIRAGGQAEMTMDVVGPLALEVAAGALAAFVRDEFVIDPTGFGLRAPLVAPVGRLGFLVRLQ